MKKSWISGHSYGDDSFRGWMFLVHDVGFVFFLFMGFCLVVSICARIWAFHRIVGRVCQNFVFPVVAVSGMMLCLRVEPRDDWIIFASYGMSWMLLYVQQVFCVVSRPGHVFSLIHNAWMFVHLFRNWNDRNHDLFWILVYLPWMHMDWMLWKSRCVRRRDIHKKTGQDLLYMGVMGTVFSFTHEPYMQTGHYSIMKYVYISMHITMHISMHISMHF